jgi:hypothetical protein
VKAHLHSTDSPISNGQPLTAACGAEIEKSFAVLSLDTAFTVGHSVREIVSANTLLFCRKCFAAPLTGRYLYAVHEGQEEPSADSEA